MKPYFDVSHVAGLLFTIVTLCWSMMELAKASNQRQGATRVGGAGRQFVMLPSVVVAGAAVYFAPRLVPAAAIRPAVASFTAGIAIMVAGLVLRGWAIKTLGDYFTGTVMVSEDQPLVTAGPYRLLRHPSYTGLLLALAGAGLASANWAGLVVIVVLPLAAVLWRIRAEERALLAALGDRYRAYAAAHRRLIPAVW